MNIIQQKVLNATLETLPFSVPLAERVIYSHLVSKYEKHWLVQLEQVLDLTALEQGCAGFHQGQGKGSAITHPVPRLVRALLVKYLFDSSYRGSEEMIDRDLLVKWFVGYGLFESPPDHTTLNRFELWVLNNQPHLFFDDILSQIKVLDPRDWQEDIQLVDTFAMLARAAKGRLIPLIRDTCRQLLTLLEAADLERHALLVSHLDLIALFGQKGDKPTRALKAQERAERLQQVVNQALHLHRLITFSLSQQSLPAESHLALEEWLAVLHKIIFDETTVTPPETEPDAAEPDPTSALENEPPASEPPVETEPEVVEPPLETALTEADAVDIPPSPPQIELACSVRAAQNACSACPVATACGQNTCSASPTSAPIPLFEPVAVTEREHKKKGQYRIVSLNDRDATFRHHGADKGEAAKIAHNASLLTGRYYVHWCQADTGARPDPEALSEMLLDQFDHFGFFPPKVGADQIYGYGKVRAAVDRATDGQTQVVALLPNTIKKKDRYGPLDFDFDPVTMTLTCPAGVVSDKFTDKPYDGGWAYRFTAKMCQGCDRRNQCRNPEAKSNSRRSVFVSYYRDYNLAALEYNHTDQFKTEIKQRPIIERIIFNLTNIHGARRAKSTGTPKANFQLRMASTAFNIRQVLRRRAFLKPKPPAVSDRPGAESV